MSSDSKPTKSGETIPIMNTGGNKNAKVQMMIAGVIAILPKIYMNVLERKGIRIIKALPMSNTTNTVFGDFLFSERIPPQKYPKANPPKVIAKTVDQTCKEDPK